MAKKKSVSRELALVGPEVPQDETAAQANIDEANAQLDILEDLKTATLIPVEVLELQNAELNFTGIAIANQLFLDRLAEPVVEVPL